MLPKVQKTKKLDTWVVGGRKNVQIMRVEGVEVKCYMDTGACQILTRIDKHWRHMYHFAIISKHFKSICILIQAGCWC